MISWFHVNTTHSKAPNQASPADIVACFQDHRSLLHTLAFLITGGHATADNAIATACDTTLQGNSPFRDWLLEWAKSATIASAISQRKEAIRNCEPEYRTRRCTHPEHLSQADEERTANLDVILRADAQQVIADLDPLCRAVLILRVAIRSSIQDCVIRLNVSRAAVLAANCQAMTWLYNSPIKTAQGSQDSLSDGLNSGSAAGFGLPEKA